MSIQPSVRQPAGVPVGGQFAAIARREAVSIDLEDDLDDETCACGESLEDNEGYDGKCGGCADQAERVSLVIGDMEGEEFDLVYTEYDDRLTDEQVGDVLAGRWGAVEEAVDDVFYEAREARAREVAKERVEAAGHEWSDLDEDEQTEVIDAVKDHDGSDPTGALLKSTGPKLMRTSLDQPAWRADANGLDGYNDHRDEDRAFAVRCEAVGTILLAHGVDAATPEASEAIRELVENGPYQWHEGVDLDVIWYGDVADALNRPRTDEGVEPGNTRTLSFTDPHVLLIDRMNGSGHEVTIPGRLQATLVRGDEDKTLDRTQHAYLDSDGGGYGWDAVAGVVKSAYLTQMESTWT